MGIHGIYKEIGPGQRIALSKLAVEKFEQSSRPLRIAIDISIWLFQIQSGKGGTNPALRTFYYRLLRLISLNIHPLFVFDGPNKPPFKRNRKTGPSVASIPEFLAKQLLKKFGLPFHIAPGEAEAECALLQREGIVDAVLSEDVDTLMFGSGITLRNWSAEHAGQTPTHVNLYDAEKTKAGPSGLDREGMILVALMSGGDYIPEGIPGCGPKLACEAARAGFGRDLCQIPRRDTEALKAWRVRLAHEIKTNESKFFRQRRTKLVIPEDFPNSQILGYYTHPAISNSGQLERLRQSLQWDQSLDFPELRVFTAEAFEWINFSGAKKFVRNLAQALITRELRLQAPQPDSTLEYDSVKAILQQESRLVKSIHGKRTHPTTDSTPELRVCFKPIELVPIDLSAEPPDDESPGNSDSENEAASGGENDEPPTSSQATKKRGPLKYDPTQLEKIWIPESYVKVGAPLTVQDWEEDMRKKQEKAASKPSSKRTTRANKPKRSTSKSNTSAGAMDQYTRVTKPGVVSRRQAKSKSPTLQQIPRNIPRILSFPEFQKPPRLLYSELESPLDTPERQIINFTQPEPPIIRSVSPPACELQIQEHHSTLPQSPTIGTEDTPIELLSSPIRGETPSQIQNAILNDPVLFLSPNVTKRKPRSPPARSRTNPLHLPNDLSLLSTFVKRVKAKLHCDQLPEPQTQSRQRRDIDPRSGSTARQSTIGEAFALQRSRSSTPSKHKPRQPPLELSRIPEVIDLSSSSPKQPSPLNDNHSPKPQGGGFNYSRGELSPFPYLDDFSGFCRSQNTTPLAVSPVAEFDRSLEPTSEISGQKFGHTSRSGQTSSVSGRASGRSSAQTGYRRKEIYSSSSELSTSSLARDRSNSSLRAEINSQPTPHESSIPIVEPKLRRSPRLSGSASTASPSRVNGSWKAQPAKKRMIRLRDSLSGAWGVLEVEEHDLSVSPARPAAMASKTRRGAPNIASTEIITTNTNIVRATSDAKLQNAKTKDRRIFRYSEVEVLDLT